ncbi:MAG: hypothetical protein KBD37_08450 [Burkholderiales bacterium]|nr:hypothetical protein [Burkholderiales bacterium]
MEEFFHGTALSIFNCGVIISGESGMGKSELALELISRGHQLIADDMVCLTKVKNQVIMSNFTDKFFIHIRGMGFIDIVQTFGLNSAISSQQLTLIIQLSNTNILTINPLTVLRNTTSILDSSIITYELPIGRQLSLPVLVEVMIKQHLNTNKAHQAFIDQHDSSLMEHKLLCN